VLSFGEQLIAVQRCW